jgi:hypothetical protein
LVKCDFAVQKGRSDAVQMLADKDYVYHSPAAIFRAVGMVFEHDLLNVSRDLRVKMTFAADLF